MRSDSGYHRLVKENSSLEPNHWILYHKALAHSSILTLIQRGSKQYFSLHKKRCFQGERLHKRNPLLACLLFKHGNVWAEWPSGLGQQLWAGEASRHSTHTPIKGRQCSDSPAGQDPDNVIGLVPFNTNRTVVKIRLCFLQQRKHRWTYFWSFDSCKYPDNKPRNSLPGARLSTVYIPVSLINNLLHIGIVCIPSNLHFLLLGSTGNLLWGNSFLMYHYLAMVYIINCFLTIIISSIIK